MASDAESLAQVGGIILFTVPGVLIGGQLGPIVQQRLRPAVVKRGIGVLLFIVGLVMFGTAL